MVMDIRFYICVQMKMAEMTILQMEADADCSRHWQKGVQLPILQYQERNCGLLTVQVQLQL